MTGGDAPFVAGMSFYAAKQHTQDGIRQGIKKAVTAVERDAEAHVVFMSDRILVSVFHIEKERRPQVKAGIQKAVPAGRLVTIEWWL